MVPHPHGHHPPPHLPYFAPFHLGPPPAEYPASVELAPIGNYNEQSPQPPNQYQPPPQPVEEHPKVVVPNIEEELNFLSQGEVNLSVSSIKYCFLISLTFNDFLLQTFRWL